MLPVTRRWTPMKPRTGSISGQRFALSGVAWMALSLCDWDKAGRHPV